LVVELWEWISEAFSAHVAVAVAAAAAALRTSGAAGQVGERALLTWCIHFQDSLPAVDMSAVF
jgi:hypothetical protein